MARIKGSERPGVTDYPGPLSAFLRTCGIFRPRRSFLCGGLLCGRFCRPQSCSKQTGLGRRRRPFRTAAGSPPGRRESRAETVPSRRKGSRSHRGGRTGKEPGRPFLGRVRPGFSVISHRAGKLPAAPSAAFARRPDEARGNARRTGGDPPACRSPCDRGEAVGTARQNCSVRIPPKSGRRIRRPLNDIRVDGKRA